MARDPRSRRVQAAGQAKILHSLEEMLADLDRKVVEDQLLYDLVVNDPEAPEEILSGFIELRTTLENLRKDIVTDIVAAKAMYGITLRGTPLGLALDD